MIFNRDTVTSPSISAVKRSQIIDHEFGVVAYRRSPQARFVRIRVTEDGSVRASLPRRAPLYMIKQLLDSSRAEIRALVQTQHAKRVQYSDGMAIGHSHRLSITHEAVDAPKGRLRGQDIHVVLPLSYNDDAGMTHNFVSKQVKRALKREAEAYLPRRLRHLANIYGFEYERERFGNQRGRWGSCSSSGTISLNVALMNLPHEIIDYVLVHELVHTQQMNHSPEFWGLVEDCMPDYAQFRKELKTMSPIC